MVRACWLQGAILGLAILLWGPVTKTSGQAVAPAAPVQTPRTYQPGEVHLESSRIFIHVGKTGLGHEHAVAARLRQASGQPGASQNVGDMVFDMASFQADTDEARKYIGLEGTSDAATRQKVTANMLGPDVLDVQRYPTATCHVQSVRPLAQASAAGYPQWELDCQFTLHGVTRPLRFVVEAVEKDGWTHARGRFSILQTDYGIKPYSLALGTIGVADRLDIYGDLWIAGTNLAPAQGAAPR